MFEAGRRVEKRLKEEKEGGGGNRRRSVISKEIWQLFAQESPQFLNFIRKRIIFFKSFPRILIRERESGEIKEGSRQKLFHTKKESTSYVPHKSENK